MTTWTLYNNKKRSVDMQFSSPIKALDFLEGLAANFRKFNCTVELEGTPFQIKMCVFENGVFSGSDEPNECSYTLVCQE